MKIIWREFCDEQGDPLPFYQGLTENGDSVAVVDTVYKGNFPWRAMFYTEGDGFSLIGHFPSDEKAKEKVESLLGVYMGTGEKDPPFKGEMNRLD